MNPPLPTRPSRFTDSPLAHEAFRAIWLAAIFSNVGTFVQDVGESWLMLSLTHDALPVAMLTTAFTVPSLLLMMPAGVLADRWDRRRILLVAQSIQTACAFMLAVTTWLGWTTPAVLLVSSAGLGIGSALSSPAWNSIIPELVPRKLTAEAVTLNSVAFNIARAVGPALGGLVLAARGPGMAFFLNALSFLAVIEVLRRYTAFKEASARALAVARKRRGESIRRALFAAVHVVRTTGSLRAPHLAVAAFGLAAASVPALLSLFAKDVLGASATGYGMMLGAIGVGAVTGAVLLKRWRSAMQPRAVIGGAMAMYGLAALAMSTTRSLPVAVLLLLPAGVGWIASLSSLNALVQLAAPPHLKSRVLALYQVAFLASWSVGSTIGGFVANDIGVARTLTLAATCVLAAAAWSSRLALPSWDTQPVASDPLATPLPASVR
jgi:MFS family permease